MSFSPWSIRIPVELETLPIVLRFGIILDSDCHNIGQSDTQALDGLKDVMFS